VLDAIRRSGDPAIRRSGDPAIRRAAIAPEPIPTPLWRTISLGPLG